VLLADGGDEKAGPPGSDGSAGGLFAGRNRWFADFFAGGDFCGRPRREIATASTVIGRSTSPEHKTCAEHVPSPSRTLRKSTGKSNFSGSMPVFAPPKTSCRQDVSCLNWLK